MITVIDYKAGNPTSVRQAFKVLGQEVEVTDIPAHIEAAERVVFPGVGAAASAMSNLAALDIINALKHAIDRGVPLLGICLGMQIMLGSSEEDGGVETLSLIPGTVKLFRPAEKLVKVPHMGWDDIEIVRPHPVLKGIPPGSQFYFVHSYYAQVEDETYVFARTDYAGVKFASVVGTKSFIATQFHPEKSGETGLQILKNFIGWDGTC